MNDSTFNLIPETRNEKTKNAKFKAGFSTFDYLSSNNNETKKDEFLKNNQFENEANKEKRLKMLQQLKLQLNSISS